jgi:hypothetical protein
MTNTSYLGDIGSFLASMPANSQAAVYAFIIGVYSIMVILIVLRIRTNSPTILSYVSTSLLSPLGAIFGLTATFLIADVWNKNADAELAVNNEALSVNQILSIAPSLPYPLSNVVRDKTLNYWHIVINEELPILATIKTIDNDISKRARHELYELLSIITTNTQPSIRTLSNLIDNTFKYRAQRMVVAVDVTESKRIELCILLAFFVILGVAVTHSENTRILTATTASTAMVTSLVICFAVINGKPFDYKASLLTKAGFFNIVDETRLLSTPIDMDNINDAQSTPASGFIKEPVIKSRKAKQ